ncbi:MAG: hypothetical protein AB1Z98_11870 [Nannocystaceae bacterium]
MLRLVLLLLGPLVMLGIGCHDDVGNDSDLVGGSCRDDRDCVEKCQEGGKFPGGTCTVECRDDRDCPGGTWCIDEAGGICLLECSGDGDCRGGYSCKDKDREGAGGKMDVCID